MRQDGAGGRGALVTWQYCLNWAGTGSPPSAVPAVAVLSAAVYSAPQLLAPVQGWYTDKRTKDNGFLGVRLVRKS
jgi:hypothetical protein